MILRLIACFVDDFDDYDDPCVAEYDDPCVADYDDPCVADYDG
jgi:hypothetical protein